MELAKTLCNAYGPAGREENIRKIIKSEIDGLCEHIETDRLGNLIAYFPAASRKNEHKDEVPKIMFCAHMDEIGLIVTHIDKNGFLRFTNVGGLFIERIMSQRIIFENGTVGIIGVETKPETPKPPRIDNLFIDINVKDKKEAEEKICIGDIASFHQTAIIANRHIVAKALDDRIGCYCLIETMKRINKSPCDLYFVFTVQEEVGLRGARTGAYGIAPDYAIAVDITLTGDTPESNKMAVDLGRGTAIKVKDQMFLANPVVKDKLINFCEEKQIPFQLEILEKGTTDAAVVQMVKEGVISGVVSIPTRYIHSTSEVCDLDDVENTIKLLVMVCEKGLG
jgi:putative aminopeptidase FrvX